MMARSITLGGVGCLVLSACVAVPPKITDDTPVWMRSHWTYREALLDQLVQGVLMGPYSDIPNRVRAEYAECTSTYIMSKFTRDERATIEAWNKGEMPLTIRRLRELDQNAVSRAGGQLSYETIDRLGEVCPQWLPDFHQNLPPGFAVAMPGFKFAWDGKRYVGSWR